MHPNNPFGVEPPASFYEALPLAVAHTQATISPARRAVMRMAGDKHPRANSPGDTQRDSAEHRRVGYTYLQG
jgi:hypothetical protein